MTLVIVYVVVLLFYLLFYFVTIGIRDKIEEENKREKRSEFGHEKKKEERVNKLEKMQKAFTVLTCVFAFAILIFPFFLSRWWKSLVLLSILSLLFTVFREG